MSLSCFGINRRGGRSLGQASSYTAIIKNKLLPMAVALTLVGVVLIKIIIAIMVRREYVSHVITQCPGRVASTAGASSFEPPAKPGYSPRRSWSLSPLTLNIRTRTNFLLKIFVYFPLFPRNTECVALESQNFLD